MTGSGGTGKAVQSSRRATICNKRGLHARAAARFVKLADTFNAKITVLCKGQSVSGVSIMGLMMLAAAPGTELEILAAGGDAEAAVAALKNLVDARFEED